MGSASRALSQLLSRARRVFIGYKAPSPVRAQRQMRGALDSRPWGRATPVRPGAAEERRFWAQRSSTLRPGCPISSLFLSGKPEAHGWRLNWRGLGIQRLSLRPGHALHGPQFRLPRTTRPQHLQPRGHRQFYRFRAASGPNRQGASTAQKLGAASCRCHGDHSAVTTAAAETQTLYSRLTERARPPSTTHPR